MAAVEAVVCGEAAGEAVRFLAVAARSGLPAEATRRRHEGPAARSVGRAVPLDDRPRRVVPRRRLVGRRAPRGDPVRPTVGRATTARSVARRRPAGVRDRARVGRRTCPHVRASGIVLVAGTALVVAIARASGIVPASAIVLEAAAVRAICPLAGLAAGTAATACGLPICRPAATEGIGAGGTGTTPATSGICPTGLRAR